MKPRIEEWMLFEDGSIYGYLFNHPDTPQGHMVWLRDVRVSKDHKTLQTADGTVYELGSKLEEKDGEIK